MDKTNEIVLFEAEDKETKLYVPIEQDGIVITRHVNNVFKEKELDKKAMCKKCTLQMQIRSIILILRQEN